MGTAGLLRAVFGPLPLLAQVAPLVSLAYAQFEIVSGRLVFRSGLRRTLMSRGGLLRSARFREACGPGCATSRRC